MELEIRDRMYEVKFTTKAVKKLDKKYFIEENGMKFGMGAAFAYLMLDQKSVSDLSYVLQVATKGNHSEDVIDNAIDRYAEKHDTLVGLFEELKDELGKSPVTRERVEEFLGELEKGE